MTHYLVDMDGTLCRTPGMAYGKASPIRERIEHLNAIASREDSYVTIWTARGSATGEDHGELTRRQLREWGVQYDELSVGEKPPADLIVDDRAIHSDDFFRGVDEAA